MKKNLINLLFLSFLFISCDDHLVQENLTEEDEKQNFAVAVDTTHIFSLQNEVNADFSKVKLVSNNENKLLIDKRLIDSRTDVDRFKKDNVITTFLNDTTVVLGKIDTIELIGNEYSVDITRLPMNELFQELDIAMNLNGFIDQSAPSTRAFPNLDTRSNTLYPDRIIAIDRRGEPKVYNSDDPVTRASWSYNMSFPLDGSFAYDTGHSKFELAFNDGYVNAGIETILCVNFSWFRLKYFEASANGYIDAHVPMTLSVKAKTNKELTKTLYSSKYYSVFFIYCIPVVVSYGPSVDLQATVELEGKVDLGFDYNASFSCGGYYDGNWWQDAKSSSDFKFHTPSLSSKVSLGAEIGLVPYAKIGLYGVDLGKVGVGGYVGSKLSAVDEDENSKLVLNAYWRLGGSVSLGILPLGKNTTYTKKFNISGPNYFYEKEWLLPVYDEIAYQQE